MSFCNNCTNCLNRDDIRDFTREAQIILSTVFRTREKFGISVLVDILRGIKGPKIIPYNLDKITTFSLTKNIFCKTFFIFLLLSSSLYNIWFNSSITKRLKKLNI